MLQKKVSIASVTLFVLMIIFGLSGMALMISCDSGDAYDSSQDENTIWSIGKADGLSIEFMAESQSKVSYLVGEDEPSGSFPGHHAGSVRWDGKIQKNPYKIIFDMPEDEEDNEQYRLMMDLIYQNSSPEEIEVTVNGKRGVFPVRYTVKEDLDDDQANNMLLASQQLVVPVEASWLKKEDNEIVVAPLGKGGMDYDALTFKKGEETHSLIAEPHLSPTVFYHNHGERMTEVAELEIPFTQAFKNGNATIEIGGEEITTSFEPKEYDFGVLTHSVDIPAFEEPEKAEIEVQLDDETIQVTADFVPAKKWTFYVTPRVHNDVGFTDLQPHVNELDNRNTDRILDVLDRYPFYVFNFETSWLADNYLESRTAPYRDKFLKYASEGRAPLNAFYLNLLTGLSSGEELYRATYFSHKLHKKHGTNFDWASLTDAPSHSWFLPTLLTDIGVKGFVVGSNQTRAPILRFSDLNEYSPFYWEGMNGEKIMKWYSRSYMQLAKLSRGGNIAGPPDLNLMKRSIPQFLIRYQRKDYAPDAVMIYGAYLDNALIPKEADAPIIEEWNEEYAYPKVVTASDADFYDYINENFKDDLPTYRGGAGAYWEDGAASTAQATKLIQHTQETLPMAETAASLSSILMPKHIYRSELFSEAWKNVLFYNEHTWGALHSINQPDREIVTRQWEIKESYAKKADLSARTLLTRSLNRLSQLFEVSGNTIFAFNFQPWERSNPIEVELDEGTHLVDLEKDKPVEHDVIYEKEGYKKIRFIAENVPAMGYKSYAVRSLKNAPKASSEQKDVSGTVAESPYYKLTLDTETGGIVSLYDKSAGKEMVDKDASYVLNEYLYVTGGEDSKVLHHGMSQPPADLTVHEPASAEIVEHIETPIGQRLVVETQSKNTPFIRSEYRLYNDLKRVDITNTIEKESILDKEGVYFAFPFKTEEPDFAYQIQNGWLRPNKDQLPGAAREWFTTQNLVRLNDNNYTIAWSAPDAPLFTLTDINRGKWPQHLEIDNGHIFSYIMNNYWFTNYKASQGGEFTFNYSITSGEDLRDEELAHFDADLRKPVLGYSLLSSFSASVQAEDRPLSSDRGSFMDLGSPNLQFVTLKQAEDGDGYILRFRETAGAKGETEITSSLFEIEEVHITNGVEENKRKLNITDDNSVRVPYKSNSYTTVRLDIKGNI